MPSLFKKRVRELKEPKDKSKITVALAIAFLFVVGVMLLQTTADDFKALWWYWLY